MPTFERSKLAAIVTANLKQVSVITYDTVTRHIAFYTVHAGTERVIDLATDERSELFSVPCTEEAVHAFTLFAAALTGSPFAKQHKTGDHLWRFARREPAAPRDRTAEVDTDRIIAGERPSGRYSHRDEEGTDKHPVPRELIARTTRETGEVTVLEPPSTRDKKP